MTATMVLSQQIADELEAMSRLPVETAGVLPASLVATDDENIRILSRKMCWVPESSYIQRGGDHLSIASEGYVPFLAEAEAMGAVALWFHTHPGNESLPRPSKHDEQVDRQIADLFRFRSGNIYYGTLIFATRLNGVAFSGYIQLEGQSKIPIARVWHVGDRFRLTQPFDHPESDIEPIFDRNVRAFGGSVQRALGSLKVGVVGCGGTGPAVAEQLTRLGVRHFFLFDPDSISASNVTRVYGSTAKDVGDGKGDVLAAHLGRIAPEVQIEMISSMITLAPAAKRLISCDVVFGCTVSFRQACVT